MAGATNRDDTRLVRREAWLAGIAVGFAGLATLVALLPEILRQTPALNDTVLHQVNVMRARAAIVQGEDATDPWLAPITLGFPLFEHYQHLPYLPLAEVIALVARLLRTDVGVDGMIAGVTWLLLGAFPAVVAWSVRRLGFSWWTAGGAALLGGWFATNGYYGLDWSSYLWRGYGLFTQLWAMLLMPVAVALGFGVIRDGRGWFGAIACLAALIVSHLVMGYLTILALVLIALVVGHAPLKLRLLRLAVLGLGAAIPLAYFLVPYAQDAGFVNRSVWEFQWKYESLGGEWVLSQLASGELFDHGRFPIVTALVVLGIVTSVVRWGQAPYRVVLVLFAAMLALFFGRPTWGALLDILPMVREMHLHRAIAGVHLAALPLAGIGLATATGWLVRGPRLYLAAGLLATALLTAPVVGERWAYAAENGRFMEADRAAFAAEAVDLERLQANLAALPPGRVYAGLAATWGRDYRVGSVPMYAVLQRAGFDMLGFLYHALALTSDTMVLFDETNTAHYNVFNVRYVVAPRERAMPGFLRPIGAFGRHVLYTADLSSGYFDLGGAAQIFEGPREELLPAVSAWLASPVAGVRWYPTVYLGAAPAGLTAERLAVASFDLPQAPFAATYGRVLAERPGDGRYEALVEAAVPATVVLKATYHPNWKATVGGQAVDPYMVFPAYAAVNVAPGRHVVIFEYQSKPYRGPLFFLGLGFLVLLAVAGAASKQLRGVVAGFGLAGALERWSDALDALGGRLRRLVVGTGVASHGPWLLATAMAALLAGLPLLQFRLMEGHDTLNYLPRNVEFVRALESGQLPPRWAPHLSAGYGEPLFLFTPPLPYLTTALARLVTPSFIVAENLATLGMIGLAAAGMYLLAGSLFGRRGGFLAAVAYVFAPYFLANLYVRHALADFSAFACLPFAFWGLWQAGTGQRPAGALAVGALGTAGIVLSSNPLALVAVPALLAWAVTVAWLRRSWRVLALNVTIVGLGLGVSAWFWLPAFVERDLVHTARLLQGYLNYQNHFVYLAQLLWSPWGYGLSLPGLDDGFSFQIGLAHLAGLVIAAVLVVRRLRHRDTALTGALAFFIALAVVAALLTINESLIVWRALPILQYLEFPWRLLSLVAFASAIAVGSIVAVAVPRNEPLQRALAVGIALVVVGLGVGYARPAGYLLVDEAQFTPEQLARRAVATTTAREYEPVTVLRSPTAPPDSPVVFFGDAEIVELSRTPTRLEYVVDALASGALRINTHAFPGWTVTVNGRERPLRITAPDGLMEIDLTPGRSVVVVEFRSTAPRAAGDVVGTLSMLTLVAAVVWLARRHRRA